MSAGPVAVYAFNIGMNTSRRFKAGVPTRKLTRDAIMTVLRDASFHVQASALIEGEDEDTMSVQVWDENPLSLYSLRERITEVGHALLQDCIAVVPIARASRIGGGMVATHLYDKGRLIGPHSDKWPSFDRAFFKECGAA